MYKVSYYVHYDLEKAFIQKKLDIHLNNIVLLKGDIAFIDPTQTAAMKQCMNFDIRTHKCLKDSLKMLPSYQP